MKPPALPLLNDLLECQEKQRQRLLKYNNPPRPWLGKKRHQLLAKIDRSWDTSQKVARHINEWLETDDGYPLALLVSFGFLLVCGVFAPWYINLATFVVFPFAVWGLVETIVAYYHKRNEKNHALQWGDSAVFKNENGKEITEAILDKNKYLALLRAAGRKHPHLSEISQKLIDTVDSTYPYNAHQIAMLLEKKYKVDGWSILETHPNLMVEVDREIQKEAREVCPNNKIMKI